MITMEAVIENNEFGSYDWSAFLRYVPVEAGRRSRFIGKLKPPFSSTYNTANNRIKRAAERLGAKLLKIDLYERDYAFGRGRILSIRRIWEAK